MIPPNPLPEARKSWLPVILIVAVFGSLTAAVALPSPRPADTPDALPVFADLPLPQARPAFAGDGHFVDEILVEPKDTLSRLLARGGISDPDVLLHFQRDLASARVSRLIRPGQNIQIVTLPDGSLKEIALPNGAGEWLVIERHGGALVSRAKRIEYESVQAYAAGTIEHSLFAATDRAGVPDSVAVQLAEIFSGEIDFHRDIRPGDRFAVVYERLLQFGQPQGSGSVLAASYRSGNRQLTAIRFEDSQGRASYYAPDGQSMRRAFLRSPLEFSRITSRFTGSRFHPVLQQWRAHRGVDYGAPVGTPVRATADGTIEFIGWHGGYGNLLIVRHTGNRSTAYGHLNGFAKGLRRGARVDQGQTIGYVGQTGLASGPHLHYEFRVNGKPVNPLAATIPDAPPLKSADLARFSPVADQAIHQLTLAERVLPAEDS